MRFTEREACCSHCGAENPATAVMCWACYAPVGQKGLGRFWTRLRLLSHGLYWNTRHAICKPQTSDEEPITRILNTILFYAVQDKADQIVIEAESVPTKNRSASQLSEMVAELSQGMPEWKEDGQRPTVICVLYRIDGQWCEQMKIPGFVLEPLVQNVRLRFQPDQSTLGAHSSLQSTFEGVMQWRSKGRELSTRATIEASGSGDKITLYLN